MKLCGCKETCFVNGEKVWGRHGGVLCLHATEENVDGVAVGICGKTKERVRGYISEWQYKEVKQVIQPDPNNKGG
jgi:hypothetical protein